MAKKTLVQTEAFPSREQESSAELNEDAPTLPTIWGFGLESREGKFLACRLSTSGDVVYLGPKSNTGPRPESKALALTRLMEALQLEYAPHRAVRSG